MGGQTTPKDSMSKSSKLLRLLTLVTEDIQFSLNITCCRCENWKRCFKCFNSFIPLTQAGMLAVRENRYIVLAKDFEKAYKTVIKKDEQEHEFYKQKVTSPPLLPNKKKKAFRHTFCDLCVFVSTTVSICGFTDS